MPHEQVPSVGRVVHTVAHGSPVLVDGAQVYRPGECRAALVTGVNPDGTIAVVSFTRQGHFHNDSVVRDDAAPEIRRGGSWHWPERVGE